MSGERKFAKSLTGLGSAAKTRKVVSETMRESTTQVGSIFFQIFIFSFQDFCLSVCLLAAGLVLFSIFNFVAVYHLFNDAAVLSLASPN